VDDSYLRRSKNAGSRDLVPATQPENSRDVAKRASIRGNGANCISAPKWNRRRTSQQCTECFPQVDESVVTNLDKVVSIDLATFSDVERGSLTVVQAETDIPIAIARIFYIYGTKRNKKRGAHAHRETTQVFIAISGSCLLELKDPNETRTFPLRDPGRAIYVPPMIWADLRDFSENAVCLVLTDTPYDPADYIRDWEEYVVAMRSQKDSIRSA
jgi:dTDP-4-dehydrorhamnose 3,5-epimerase-like enzyme